MVGKSVLSGRDISRYRLHWLAPRSTRFSSLPERLSFLLTLSLPDSPQPPSTRLPLTPGRYFLHSHSKQAGCATYSASQIKPSTRLPPQAINDDFLDGGRACVGSRRASCTHHTRWRDVGAETDAFGLALHPLPLFLLLLLHSPRSRPSSLPPSIPRIIHQEPQATFARPPVLPFPSSRFFQERGNGSVRGFGSGVALNAGCLLEEVLDRRRLSYTFPASLCSVGGWGGEKGRYIPSSRPSFGLFRSQCILV